MEILFRQSRDNNSAEQAVFSAYGIEGCLLKHLSFLRDRTNVTRKRHYHRNFEVHLIEKGFQIYETDAGCFYITAGQTLLIPPGVTHEAVEEDACTVKHAVSFSVLEGGLLENAAKRLSSPLVFDTPQATKACIQKIREEATSRLPYFSSVVSLCAFECVLSLFRQAGLPEDASKNEEPNEDDRFLLVQQYINDNVRRPISVSELASYVCISKKQLERIFVKEAGVSVMTYVRQKRCAEIEKLLSSPLSLREISEEMGFLNEYYFNAYFKKYAGMTPGAYRRSVL